MSYKAIQKIKKILLRTFLFTAGFFVLYVIAAFTLPYIPVNRQQDAQKEYSVYILTNGVHTDLVLPVRNELKDWSEELSYTRTAAKDSQSRFIAFGWGDKGFYLETPTWAELKARTAFNAMFFLSTSAMHVTFYRSMEQNAACRKIAVSRKQYLDLVDYIHGSFLQDAQHRFVYIPAYAYGPNDCFYDAKGVYNLFFTCNTWANKGLKKAGLKACLWTALDKGIFYHYR